MTEALTVIQPQNAAVLSMKQVADRVNIVHQILDKVMKKGTHYGTVPGCGNKNVLFKPGADVLAMTFRLVPRFEVTRTDLETGHREYDVTCSMYAADGSLLGQGVGSASTMEVKYRYRKEYCDDGDKKDSNGKYRRIENPDIADCYNNVLKIAKKRAHIDATLTVTGAADMFTQDIIDEEDDKRDPIKDPRAKIPPTATPTKAQEPAQEGEPVTVDIVKVGIKRGGTAEKPWARY